MHPQQVVSVRQVTEGRVDVAPNPSLAFFLIQSTFFTMAKPVVETPLMRQYFQIKQKHPDAILLFRVGDFYETFSENAIVASEILKITLTRRAKIEEHTSESSQIGRAHV